MNNLPWCVALSTGEAQDDDFVLTRSVDGTGRGQSFYNTTKGVWTGTIAGLDATQLQAFREFYAAHRNDPFSFDPFNDGHPVSAIFGGGYKVSHLAGALQIASVGVMIIEFP